MKWCKAHWLDAYAWTHDTLGRVEYACAAWVAYPHLLEPCQIAEAEAGPLYTADEIVTLLGVVVPPKS